MRYRSTRTSRSMRIRQAKEESVWPRHERKAEQRATRRKEGVAWTGTLGKRRAEGSMQSKDAAERRKQKVHHGPGTLGVVSLVHVLGMAGWVERNGPGVR